ncbi:recombinase family protein, partial [Actinomycetota bacterium]
STDEQTQNQSIKNQIITFEDFYAKNDEYENYGFYEDDGISGTIPFEKRPGGARLLKDAREEKFDVVIVTSTDRLGRSLKIMLETVDTLSEMGIGFKSITEPYHTETPEGRMMFGTFANFSEFELNSIKRRSKIGKERAIDEGKWPGGLPPYGYEVNKDTKKLILYDDKVLLGKYSEVDVIKKIFGLCANHRLATHRIAEKLNQEQISPYTAEKNEGSRQKKAKYWRPERVRNLLKEPVYKGEFIIGRRSNGTIKKSKQKVPSIVSVDVWEEAHRVLKSNILTATRNSKYEYLLSGKLVCSECKRGFSGHNDHGIFYYMCNNNRFKSNGDPYKCHNAAIRSDVLEQQVWQDIESIIKNPDLIRVFLEQRLKAISNSNPEKVIEDAQKNLKSIERQKQNLVSSIKYSDGYLMESVEKEINDLKLGEERQLKIISDYQNKDKQMEQEKCEISLVEVGLAKMIDKIKNPKFNEKKEIVNILLDKIVVHPKNDSTKRCVEIFYRFKENSSPIDISTSTAL